MNDPIKRQKYVIDGIDAKGTPIRHEETSYSRARQTAYVMCSYTHNIVTIERHEYDEETKTWTLKEVM